MSKKSILVFGAILAVSFPAAVRAQGTTASDTVTATATIQAQLTLDCPATLDCGTLMWNATTCPGTITCTVDSNNVWDAYINTNDAGLDDSVTLDHSGGATEGSFDVALTCVDCSTRAAGSGLTFDVNGGAISNLEITDKHGSYSGTFAVTVAN